LLKAIVFDVYQSGVGFDGAEGSILDWDVKIGEDVECAAFADVGHAEQAHL
jgi:hypothetical protein